MTNFKLIFLFLLIFFIQKSTTLMIPPVVPLTNALTAVYCHNSNEAGIMTIRCRPNEKIRMLDAFDVVVKNKSHLPFQCLKQKHFSTAPPTDSNHTDCKVHTSYTSACSGRENCTLYMQRIRLNSVDGNCQNELVDYTMAFFECISDVSIHDVCSSQAITSTWGTLKTPNFPNPYTSSDDCWCKLSTQAQHRILLSVIIFQLIPYDQKCTGAGLYLQSSDEQRSTQCTYLQQGHNYLSDTNSLYIKFYSRVPTVRGGFWIIYEANHPNAEVHLHCGPQEKLGISPGTTSLPSPISSSYTYGWNRLAYDNPTTRINDRRMYATPHSSLNKNFKINPTTTQASAFTYPYGRLTTFELVYGPRGWYLKFPHGLSNKFLRTTTSQLPVMKWNSTWRYTPRTRTRIFTTTSTTTTTTTTIKTTTTTVSTTLSTTTITLKSTSTMTTSSTSTIPTTEQDTIPLSSATITTTKLSNITVQQRLLFTHNPWIYYNSSVPESSTTTIKSTVYIPASSSLLKTTLPAPTPWYSPAGPFDWWQWKWYTTKSNKVSLKILTTTQKTTTSTSPSLIHSSNKTVPNKPETTVDWFKWPRIQSTTPKKERSDYYDEEYQEWADFFAPTKTQTGTTRNSSASISPGRQYRKMNFFPTKPNWQLYNHVATINTPPSKRQNTVTIAERNTLSVQSNKETTNNNTSNIAQSVIEQRNKKTSEESGWFSKTDMTIVAVSMLFIFLLLIINLILFAVRRHRHRLQGRHLLSSSFPFSLNEQATTSSDQLQNIKLTDSTNSLINTTNNNDILPAVGEIVLWDEKDQGGYMIDNHGEWAKIEGQQWFGSNIFKSCSKTPFSKSFRSRFPFIRQSKKKSTYHHQQPPITPKIQQHSFKHPLLMDTAILSSVNEVDDYQTSDFSSSNMIIQHSETSQTTKTIQALVHSNHDQSDDYYKRIDINSDGSTYTTMQEHIREGQNLGNENDVEESVIVSVPTMLRQEEDPVTTTDGAESIYNYHYSVQNPNLLTAKQSMRTYKSPKNNSIIVGHCQTNFQPLDPNLLLKLTDKSLLAEHQQFYNCSPSFRLSAYDSGFFDDQRSEISSSPAIINGEIMETNFCGADDENDLSATDFRKSKPRKQRHIVKHVSFYS